MRDIFDKEPAMGINSYKEDTFFTPRYWNIFCWVSVIAILIVASVVAYFN